MLEPSYRSTPDAAATRRRNTDLCAGKSATPAGSRRSHPFYEITHRWGSSEAPFHFEFDEAVEFDRILDGQFFRDRFDEAGDDHLLGVVVVQPP